MEPVQPCPSRDPAPDIPPPVGRQRTGQSILERKAVHRVRLEIAAMPASLVVQILLWPEKLTDWARDEGVTPALVYNMLGGFKPYHGLRLRLAQRLGVAKGALDHLVDGVRPQPLSRRIPDPPPDDAEFARPAATTGSPGAMEGAVPRTDDVPLRPDRDGGDAASDDPQISFGW